MIKILFFIDSISGGGAEKVLRNLVNNMDQSKFEITVQTINDSVKADTLLKDGIRYKTINRFKNRVLNKLYQYWIRLCAELKILYPLYIKDDYDIEVAYLECGPTKIIASSTNKKAVKIAWVHCDFSKKKEMRESEKKIRRQYIRYDKIVCVSRDVELGFHKVLGADYTTTVLQNVIDEKEIIVKAEEIIDWRPKTELKNLLAVGRLSPEKNYAYLLETCGNLKNTGYQFHLNILGDGPERNNLEEIVEKLKLENYVSFRGFIKNPYPWIKKSDYLVCSSEYEGSSTVVQEALILGTIVVTTPCGGMKDLLGNSEYGLITDDRNEGLYCGLKKLMDQEKVERKYKQAAVERGKFFSKDKTVKLTERFLEELFSKKKQCSMLLIL